MNHTRIKLKDTSRFGDIPLFVHIDDQGIAHYREWNDKHTFREDESFREDEYDRVSITIEQVLQCVSGVNFCEWLPSKLVSRLCGLAGTHRHDLDMDRFEAKFTVKYIESWYCTDETVGQGIVFFELNGTATPFAFFSQSGRKSEMNLLPFAPLVLGQVIAFIRSLIVPESTDMYDMSHDIADYFSTESLQRLTSGEQK